MSKTIGQEDLQCLIFVLFLHFTQTIYSATLPVVTLNLPTRYYTTPTQNNYAEIQGAEVLKYGFAALSTMIVCRFIIHFIPEPLTDGNAPPRSFMGRHLWTPHRL